MGASVSLDSRKGQIVLGNKEGSLVINGGGMVMFGQGFVTGQGSGAPRTLFIVVSSQTAVSYVSKGF